MDFCMSVFNCNYDPIDWQLLELLVQNCGWIISLEKLVSSGHNSTKFEKMVIICERPIKLSFDNKHRLHANNSEPAIQFAYGYSLYSQHGLTLTGQ